MRSRTCLLPSSLCQYSGVTSVSSTPGHFASSSSLRCAVPATRAFEIISTRILLLPTPFICFLISGNGLRRSLTPVELRGALHRTRTQVGAEIAIRQHAVHGFNHFVRVFRVHADGRVSYYFRQ